jgi:Ribosomal L22e protein family
MVEIKVDISELKGEGDTVVEELVSFIEKKTKAKIETAANELTIRNEKGNVSKQYLRVLLRKYLHRSELKEYFKVISSKENTFLIKEKKTTEEE